MTINNQQLSGRTSNYRFDRGGKPAEMGPFIGTVMNNVDPIRTGRLQVRIQQFASGSDDNPQLWRWVNYLPPFYGVTEKTSSKTGAGTYPGNQQSYGMWFTPPDIGTDVLCFFVEGDPSQGYYVGCVINNALNHMIPAIGAAPQSQYVTQNATQAAYFANAPQLPVTEINTDNNQIDGNTRFFDQKKPVHSYQSAVFFQQGLANDPERGPIISNAQRESPSTVYGVSTPGRPIYRGLDSKNIQQKLAEGKVTPEQAKVLGRIGGHTLVMDDGDLENNNALVRLRTSKGHQIMMNDSENFFYIIHANGQTWIELGQEGTVDIFSTNSVNVRTRGTINLHADKDINMFAGGNINMKSNAATNIGAVTTLSMASQGDMTLYSQTTVGVRSDGTLALQSQSGGSWSGGSGLKFQASRIDLNGGGAASVAIPRLYPKTTLNDTTFDNSTGWQVKPNGLESIVTRAPTHEPYPYHNQGVAATVSLTEGTPTPPPAAEPVATDWSLVRKS